MGSEAQISSCRPWNHRFLGIKSDLSHIRLSMSAQGYAHSSFLSVIWSKMAVFVPVDKWGSPSHAIPTTDKKEEIQEIPLKGKERHEKR